MAFSRGTLRCTLPLARQTGSDDVGEVSRRAWKPKTTNSAHPSNILTHPREQQTSNALLKSHGVDLGVPIGMACLQYTVNLIKLEVPLLWLFFNHVYKMATPAKVVLHMFNRI